MEQRIGELTTLINELIDGIAAARATRSQLERLVASYPDADTLQEPETSA